MEYKKYAKRNKHFLSSKMAFFYKQNSLYKMEASVNDMDFSNIIGE